MKANISEIFQSIQGEGKYAGVKQVFVRFFGCNMRCCWCDTPDSIGDTSRVFREMTLEAVVKKIEDLWDNCHSVSLTGGEPLFQADFIKELAPVLKKKGMLLYLETAGILYEPLEEVVDFMDIISMDIKIPSSTLWTPCWKDHEEFIRIALKDKNRDVFFKAVVTNITGGQDMEKAVALVKDLHPQGEFIIQLNTAELRSNVLKRARYFQDYAAKHLANVKVLPQMHKILQVR